MRVLVFQHLNVEHPGSFCDLMRAAGWRWDTIELDTGEVLPDITERLAGRYDLLLVMGGPMDVWQEHEYAWLIAEKAAIRHWVAECGKPFLGICLGHQLLAAALGGEVGLMRRPEVGVTTVRLTATGRNDPLFAGLAETFDCVAWHGAEIKRLPPAATILAWNDRCDIQAFRVGRHAYGLQYHVEVTDQTTTEWAAVTQYKQALCAVLGNEALPSFTSAVDARLSNFNTTAARMFANLQALLEG